MKKSEIKEDLIDQLTIMGKDISIYESLVDDYMRYWDVKEKLLSDIKKNGVKITGTNGNGFEVSKMNESVVQLPKITGMMLTILKELGLKDPVAAKKESDIDDYC